MAELPVPAPEPLAAPSTRARLALTPRRWTALRIALDAVMLVLAVVAARIGAEAAGVTSDGQVVVWFLPPAVLALLALRGAYRDRLEVDVAAAALRAVSASALAAIGIVALAAFVTPESNPAQLVARAWVFSAVYLVLGQVLVGITERQARTSGALAKPTLIVGAGHVGARIERFLRTQPQLGLRVVGYLDADPVPGERVPDRQAEVLGSPDDFARIADETGATQVVLSFTSAPDHELMPLVRACEERGVGVALVPRMFESVNLRLELQSLGPLPLVGLNWVDPRGWQFDLKHAIDRVVSVTLLLLLAPLLLGVALAVRLSSPGPVLFRQLRVGRDGRRFDMLKFRSMQLAEPELTSPLPGVAPGGVEGADRRTPVGRFLRRTSLDELPQLINVAAGQMSLVGPRPERPEFVAMFDEEVRRYSDRHRVRSGITGLAQVQGLRGRTSLLDRVELDNYYIQNWSMTLDLKILLKTLLTGFRAGE